MGKKLAVIKLGGLAANHEATLRVLFEEMRELRKSHTWVLVHGGGKEVTQVAERFGVVSRFRDGVRLTSPEEMPIVDMVLAGRMNTYMVRTANAAGLCAVGLGGQDGRTLLAQPIDEPEIPDCRTARPAQVRTDLLKLLIKNKYLPIVHSTAMDAEGRGLNVNADEVALALASELKASALVFLSDVDGVLVDTEVVASLDKKTAQRLVAEGKISGGMVIKIQSSFQAVEKGLGRVIIGQFKLHGDLQKLLSYEMGTQIR